MKCNTERPLKDGLKTTVCDCFIVEELLSNSAKLAQLANQSNYDDHSLRENLSTIMISLQHIANRLNTDVHTTIGITRLGTSQFHLDHSDLDELPF